MDIIELYNFGATKLKLSPLKVVSITNPFSPAIDFMLSTNFCRLSNGTTPKVLYEHITIFVSFDVKYFDRLGFVRSNFRKSIFENPSSNDLMISTNINIGLWKWFEGYLDLGILKDKNQKKRNF